MAVKVIYRLNAVSVTLTCHEETYVIFYVENDKGEIIFRRHHTERENVKKVSGDRDSGVCRAVVRQAVFFPLSLRPLQHHQAAVKGTDHFIVLIQDLMPEVYDSPIWL
jgi:hypothetical protein